MPLYMVVAIKPTRRVQKTIRATVDDSTGLVDQEQVRSFDARPRNTEWIHPEASPFNRVLELSVWR